MADENSKVTQAILKAKPHPARGAAMGMRVAELNGMVPIDTLDPTIQRALQDVPQEWPGRFRKVKLAPPRKDFPEAAGWNPRKSDTIYINQETPQYTGANKNPTLMTLLSSLLGHENEHASKGVGEADAYGWETQYLKESKDPAIQRYVQHLTSALAAKK